MKAFTKRFSILLVIGHFLILPSNSTEFELNDTIQEIEKEIYAQLPTRDCSFSIGQITQANIPFTISTATIFNTNFSNITPTTNAISSNVIALPGINNTSNALNSNVIPVTGVSNINSSINNLNQFNANQFNTITGASTITPATFAFQAVGAFNGPPGLYCLAPNFSPTVTNTPQLIGKIGVGNGIGITINASNVILDFNDTVLLGVGGTTGIFITGGFSNIIIRNGTIANMTAAGITINNGNSDITGSIVIENMRFFNNGTAINVIGGFNLIFRNCRSYFSTASGFTFSQISNSIINNCISNSNNTHGFTINNSNSLVVSRCQADDNTNNGFNLNGLTRTIINSCIANQNQNGFFINPGTQASQELELIDCFAAQNTLNGFVITGNSITCNNCTSFFGTNGFLCNGTRISFNNCLAQDHTLNAFQITGNFATISNSRASNNTGIGFSMNGVSGSIIDSLASNNVNNGFQITGTGIEIISCQSLNNTANGMLINGFNNIILGCVASQNNSGNGTTSGNGILLAGTAAGAGNVATNCQVRNNTTTGNNTGINNQGTTNRIYSNFSNANGTNYINVPNVAISPSSLTPINFTTNISE